MARYDNLPASLVTMLRTSVERSPDAEATVEIGGDRLTYAQLWDRSARVAGGLRACGVKPGDRVASLLPNGLPWVLAFWGTQLAGGIAVPVNTRLAGQEIDHVIRDSGAGIIVEPREALPDGEPFVHDAATAGDVAALFYTSGTTGLPKGAMTTHANFLSNTETVRRCLGIDGDLRTLVSVPLFHVTGCNSQLLVALELGGTTVIMPEFKPEAFLAALTDERITMTITVPAVYWLALNHAEFADTDTSGVRWVAYGGAPIAPTLVERLREAFPQAALGNAFGLTETSSFATYLPHDHAATRPDSVGFSAPVVDLQLDHTGADPDVGELLIRGPNVVKGYWNMPEQTAETFADGWLRTGDLARIDDEGLVVIVDRAKDMINRGGENVYCVEVENVLTAHPDVFEVAVVGVDDEVMGEKVGAVLVPTPGHEIVVEDVLAFARARLGDFKVPQYVSISDHPLPRNAGGKVRKANVRAAQWEPC